MMGIKFSFRKIFTERGVATLYLVLMCVQIVYVEGYGVSPLKVAVMAIAPLLFLFVVPYISRVFIWGVAYYCIVLFCAILQNYVRFSTIGYLGMFLITFIVYYNLVYSGAFTLCYFIKLLRFLIGGFAVCLILQQICLLVGVRNLPIINLCNQSFLSLTKLPSLMIEPSHVARILGCLYLAYLKCCAIEEGIISFKDIFKQKHLWITLGFLWVMLTMGSGTAFIVLMVLSLYFVRKKTVAWIVPIVLCLYFIIPFLGIKQLDRSINVINATLTGDSELIFQTDNSAAVRVNPILNTIADLDISASETWVGKGTQNEKKQLSTFVSGTSKIGGIDQYGLISYILAIGLIFTCCINKIVSIETILFVVVFGAGLGNIAYGWAALMIFTSIRYFYLKKCKS